jgi:hypothetical protein
MLLSLNRDAIAGSILGNRYSGTATPIDPAGLCVSAAFLNVAEMGRWAKKARMNDRARMAGIAFCAYIKNARNSMCVAAG